MYQNFLNMLSKQESIFIKGVLHGKIIYFQKNYYQQNCLRHCVLGFSAPVSYIVFRTEKKQDKNFHWSFQQDLSLAKDFFFLSIVKSKQKLTSNFPGQAFQTSYTARQLNLRTLSPVTISLGVSGKFGFKLPFILNLHSHFVDFRSRNH